MCSNGTEQCGDSRANERSDPVAVSPQESEPYLSALEGTSNSQRSQQVKVMGSVVRLFFSNYAFAV